MPSNPSSLSSIRTQSRWMESRSSNNGAMFVCVQRLTDDNKSFMPQLTLCHWMIVFAWRRTIMWLFFLQPLKCKVTHAMRMSEHQNVQWTVPKIGLKSTVCGRRTISTRLLGRVYINFSLKMNHPCGSAPFYAAGCNTVPTCRVMSERLKNEDRCSMLLSQIFQCAT